MRHAIAAFVVACVAALAPLAASAQSNPVIGPVPFSVTVNGNAATVPLSGQGQCAVTVNAIGSATITAAVSSDNVTYGATTSFNSGAPITAIGQYGGAVGPTGLTAFRLIVSGLTAGQTASGSVTCSVGAQFSPGNPVPPASGGLGPFVLPAPAVGSTAFFDGDSITAGVGPTGCSLTFQVLVASPSGSCFADQVSIFYGTKEIGLAISGTCLELTTIGSLCNKSSATSGSLIARYQNDATFLQPGMRAYIMIGFNDAIDATFNGDTQVNPTTFEANLVTVTSAFAAKIGAPNVVLSEITYEPQGYAALVSALNAAIDDVAKRFGYALSTTSSSLQRCVVTQSSSAENICNSDATHPNNLGSTFIAADIEAANYGNAVAAVEANRKGIMQNYRLDSSTNVNSGGVSAGYLLTTGQNNTFGGAQACQNLASGSLNTCYGEFACSSLTSQSGETCIGAQSLLQNNGFEAIGIGFAAGTACTSCNGIYIGGSSTAKAAGDSNELVIGGGITGLGSSSIAIMPATTGTPGFFSATGAPTFSAPNGSIYSNYSLANPTPYINTSGASSSGTTWTRLTTPSLVSCTDSSVGVISCSATVAYTSSTSYACGMSYVGPTTTTGAATGITVVNTSNTSVTGTVVGLAVATGTATILFNCTGT